MDSPTSAEGVPSTGGKVPNAMDIRRLQTLKAEQERRLTQVGTRIERLKAQERKVWKDMTQTQRQQLKHQEVQWSRQAKENDQIRARRELHESSQYRRERCQEQRFRSLETKDIYRQQKFEENKRVGEKVRADSKKLNAALQDLREQTRQTKIMQVELRKQQSRQAKLKQQLTETHQERMREDGKLVQYGDLQEQLRAMELEMLAAEREEMVAVQQLQNSQQFRTEAFAQLKEIAHRSRDEEERMPVFEDPVMSQVSLGGLPGSHFDGGSFRPPLRSSPASTRSPRSDLQQISEESA